jgi:hypothetical protein
MPAFNPLHRETVFFDEAVKGDQLLITSRIISYRGTVIDTDAANQLTRISRTQSVNGFPTNATFQVILAAPDAEITIDFATLGGALFLGKGQFHKVGSAFYTAVGKRLVSTSLAKLQAGQTLIWRHNPASFARDSTIKLSKTGIDIQQGGVIFNKSISVDWPSLKVTHSNGRSYFQNYKSRERATVGTWNMIDNVTFQNVVGFLTDKANYRLLETA